MSGSISLNGTWQLTYAEGAPVLPPDHFTGEKLEGRRVLPAGVPAPVHQVLMEAGVLADINVGMNSLAARWVEEMWWIYRHTFTVPEEAAGQRAWLVFERLEYEATVWVNGQEVGRHANAFRPARFEVTGKLRAGENLVVVKLSAGLHSASERSATDYTGHGDSIELLTKRHWHRNPAYQSGWDWNPRLLNVGILGDVRVEWTAGPRLDQVTVFAVPSEDLSCATVHVRASVDSAEEVTGTLRARVAGSGQEVMQAVTLAAGESRHEVTLTLEQPRLWWPVGHGEQYRYAMEVTLETAGETQSVTRRTGVRRVEMDQSPHPVEGRYCILRINGRPIFCKGGNWAPADLLYSTVDADRYRKLIDLALGANFNLLRIWGGGEYMSHAFCEMCDEAGVLIWHDFIFACTKYPGETPEFLREVRREVTHVVRELAHHPSLVVWCGNNEIEEADWQWGYPEHGRGDTHHAIFHREIPRIVKQEDPSTLHWLSSPWSPDLCPPNDPTCGDQHPWRVSLVPGPANWWEYRSYVDRFPNEGGVLGASSPATLRQFLPEGERALRSLSWDHHDNYFSITDYPAGTIGRAYATVAHWTGRDPQAMEWEEYAFVSGLLQAEGLYEYIANYRRRMFSSASAIFWMYNDSWPVTHGWTIVDYYLRRKLAYHPVRRAFQPVTVVAAEEGDDVVVFGVNDTPKEWRGEVRCGLFLLAGGRPVERTETVTLATNASAPLARLSRKEWEALGTTRAGAFAQLLQDGTLVAQHRLFVARFGELEFAAPQIAMQVTGGTLTLTSDAFAWGVCLDVEGERPVADNCFDLLPGRPYTVPWAAELGEPKVVRLGNRDAVAPRAATPGRSAVVPAEAEG